MGLFIIIKKNGKVLGAIPAKAGVSMIKLKSSLRNKLKSGMSFLIVNKSQLTNFIKRLKVKGVKKKKVVKRKKRRK